MAKALMGHVGVPGSTQLHYEAARLRRRVADLQEEVDRLREENERLAALHSADLDSELVSQFSNA